VASDTNPFAALSLIVAPAILTNACSVLILSTSNRLARAVDRARELARELEADQDFDSPVGARRLRDLTVTEVRSLLLVRAMRSYYVALSGLAVATLVSLLGAVLVPAGQPVLAETLEAMAVLAGLMAVGALVYGSVLLVRDTQLAVSVLRERAASLHFRAAQDDKRDGA
jgi:hypothetical protein